MTRHRRPRRFLVPLAVVICLSLVALGAIGVWQYAQEKMEDHVASSSPKTSQTNPLKQFTPSVADGSPSTAASTNPPSCGSVQPFKPAMVRVLGQSVPSISLLPYEREDDSNIFTEPPVPPFSEPDSFAYDMVSAQASSSTGVTILTAHSFSAGASLGNDLRASLSVGDEVRLLGESGEEACYRVTFSPEVDRADFPPDLYDPSRPHQLVIIVCSDYHNGEWRKRTIWYADPVS